MRSAYKTNFILFFIFLLCFTLILVTGINKVLFVKINSFASYIYPFIWANLTFLGDTLTACAIMLLFIRKRPDLVWSGIIATIIATLIVNILKSYFDVSRPPVIIDRDKINIIGQALSRHSFPSGHTVTIFTLAGVLMFYFRSVLIRFSLIFLALLVGISRIAVGVHWPADVAAGAAMGSLFAAAGVYLVTKLGWNRMKALQLIIGFILISSNFYLLFLYDSKYEQAIYLQYSLASLFLVAGIREYYLLLRND